ncbi:MAG: glycogen synthase [bacterium]|nr:glycogen synthase [bacterium]
MLDKLKVVFVAAEALPFAKSGDLADISGSLPRKLRELGHDVKLFMPRYSRIDGRKFPCKTVFEARTPFYMDQTGSTFRLQFWQDPAGIEVYFIDTPEYFDRRGLFTDPLTGQVYPDDGERFLFFSLSVLEALDRLGDDVDVIHCNDYHTGMLPALLRMYYRHKPGLDKTGTVFSIHNLAHQGVYDQKLCAQAGLHGRELLHGGPFEFYGKLNFMKAGIECADMISTVSPQYAREIRNSAEFGYGLEGVLDSRADSLIGILNGIDDVLWSPEADDLLTTNYNAASVVTGKEVNKIAILKEAGLEYDPALPLFGIVSPLINQKGFDLFEPVMDHLMSLPIQMIVLGCGQKEIELAFHDYSSKYNDRLALLLKFDERLAHMIEGGADFLIMPSRTEPCGLNQLYSFRYGTVPIVRLTGGLMDTVQDVETATKGTGFTFRDYTPEALLSTIERATAFFGKTEDFNSLRRHIMGLDYSWEASARRYASLYQITILRQAGLKRDADYLLAELLAT